MPIVNYKGDSNQISINMHNAHIPFIKGVPSYINDSYLSMVLGVNGMTLDDGKQTARSDNAPHIYIVMPVDFIKFQGAISALYKIIKGYPTCNINVQCPDIYTGLLICDKRIWNNINIVTHRNDKIKYYRDFNLNELQPKFNNNYMKIIIPRQQMALESIYMKDQYITESGEKDIEKDKAQNYFKLNTGDKGKGVVIIKNGLDKINSLPFLADNLGERVGATIIEGYDFKNIERDIDSLLECETVLACGDTPLTYLALMLNKKVIGFFFNRFDIDNSIQYEGFSNWVCPSIGGYNNDEITELIYRMIKGKKIKDTEIVKREKIKTIRDNRRKVDSNKNRKSVINKITG